MSRGKNRGWQVELSYIMKRGGDARRAKLDPPEAICGCDGVYGDPLCVSSLARCVGFQPPEPFAKRGLGQELSSLSRCSTMSASLQSTVRGSSQTRPRSIRPTIGISL